MRHIFKMGLLLSSAVLLSACGEKEQQAAQPQQQPSVPVGVLEVVAKPQNIKVVLPGRSKAYLVAEVRPQVSGIITSRGFIEGSDVQRGESLYQIDSATYKAALISAEADLTKANAILESAQAKAARYEALVKQNSISKQDFDEAKAAYKEAKADVTVAKAAINTATINLQYTEVQAPISGRIGKSKVTAGALVTANQADSLATIQQLDPINIDIVQSSTQLLRLKSKLKAGKLTRSDDAKVELVLEDGTQYEQIGTLKFSEVSVDENTGSVTLRAEFPNPDNVLLPGMYVRAILNTGRDPQAILVPQKAITRNSKGEAMAMVVGAENSAEVRIVTTAEVIDNQWRILDGLKPGDQLIVEGLQKIRPGSPVTATPIAADEQTPAADAK